MTETTSALDARDDLRELADHYETVAALDLSPDAVEGVRAAPGSRVPPGAQEILDADEIRRALSAVDEWAEFLTHVLVDELGVTAPDSTPARLRLAGEHAAHFIDHHDELLALAFTDDLHEHRRALKHLASRGVRLVRTPVHCRAAGCGGRLVLPRGDEAGTSLVCDRDARHVILHAEWSRWPQRVQWITVEHAAKMLGTTVAAAKMRASRGKWRRVGTGREVRYSVEDVRAAAGLDMEPVGVSDGG